MVETIIDWKLLIVELIILQYRISVSRRQAFREMPSGRHPEFVLAGVAGEHCEKYRFAAVFHSDGNSATRTPEEGQCPTPCCGERDGEKG